MVANTKSATALRRASSSLSKVATPPAAARSSKNSKPSLVVKLDVSSTILSRFPHDKPTRKAPPSKSTTAPPLPPPPPPPAPVSNEKAKVVPVKSEQKPSPSPPQPESPETPSEKVASKGTAGPKAGTKRELGEGLDDSAKSKARPGPKKRQKLDCGPVDGNVTSKHAPGAATVPTHKLGPKANQGAINARLRALDRTNTPCRRWTKSTFQVKTFTGVTWQIPSWRAPKPPKVDAVGDTGEPSLPTSNTQSKENNSSHVGSEKSRVNDLPLAPSSPSPGIVVSA